MLKVSVIVPVFEPGPTLDRLMDSLLGQTMPADAFEVILVDDGSADRTPKRLAALAAAHANVRAERIAHSGWPSRPRNVGLDLARGEYVFFADQDDRLDPEGLERLTARAAEDDADVVIGKVVGHGKSVSSVLFAADRREVTLEWVPLMRLLTPHKLFRRAFVAEHGIRFPEDGRRLEDHVFALQVYLAGARVSVLAGHPVYHWIRRADGRNASLRTLDPPDYFGRVGELLDLIDAGTEPGKLRDQLYRHYLRSKLLPRLSGGRLLDVREAYARELFDTIRALIVERFPPRLDAPLPLRLRLRAALVRSGDYAALRRFAGLEADLRAHAALVSRQDHDDQASDLRLEATLAIGRRPLTLRRRDGGLVWDAVAQSADGIDFARVLEHGHVEVSLVAAEDGAVFPLPARTEVRLDPVDGSEDEVVPVLVTEVRVDPRKAAAGHRLRPGIWRLRARPAIGGFTNHVDRLRVGGRRRRRPVRFLVTADGRLAPPPGSARRLLRSAPGPVRRLATHAER